MLSNELLFALIGQVNPEILYFEICEVNSFFFEPRVLKKGCFED